MCTFKFIFADGNTLEYKHIKSVTYSYKNNRFDVSEQKLSTYPFQSDTALWLFTESGSFGVSPQDLRCIEVTSE